MRKLDNSGLKWKSYYINIPLETGRAKAIKVGDINGDGKPDLVHIILRIYQLWYEILQLAL